MRCRDSLRALSAALVLLTATSVLAADPVAESMFQEALALMKDGAFEAACPKLDASQKLEPKSGTLMTLGSCNEQIGKTATAWAQYKEAAALARNEGRDDHAGRATELAKAIEPKLSKLRIDAQAPHGGSQLTVKLGGKVVLEGTFGVAFAIDPGTYTVEASAPDKETWTSTIDVTGGGATQIVAIPELAAVAAPQQPQPLPEPTVVPTPSPIPAPQPDVVEDEGTLAWAWVIGAIGIGSVGASIGFAVDQSAAASALDDNCGGEARDRCLPTYDFEGDHAREKRDFGLFLGFGIGGLVLVAAGIVGITTASGDPPEEAKRITPWVAPDTAGITISF